MIYFSTNKNLECRLEEEIANNVIKSFLEGEHKTITLNLDDKQKYIIVCDKVEFIEVKDI